MCAGAPFGWGVDHCEQILANSRGTRRPRRPSFRQARIPLLLQSGTRLLTLVIAEESIPSLLQDESLDGEVETSKFPKPRQP